MIRLAIRVRTRYGGPWRNSLAGDPSVFLTRRVGWVGGCTVAAGIGALQLLSAFLGGRQAVPVGLMKVVGIFLCLGGSFLHRGSE